MLIKGSRAVILGHPLAVSDASVAVLDMEIIAEAVTDVLTFVRYATYTIRLWQVHVAIQSSNKMLN
jgi:hypothetical protein